MANSEHVQIVKRGPDAIREWREQFPDTLFDLREADLRESKLVGADLGEANLGGADLRGTDLTAVDLDGADLRGTNLHGARLHGANLNGADLFGADLSGANLSEADLHMAHLSEVRLRGANLIGANLMWANLIGADLEGTHLGGANLSEALLCGANLRAADLSHAKLVGASLSGANLKDANLNGANLEGASFHGAHVGATLFANVDLSVAKELDTLRHAGPSTVGVDTLLKSQGKISARFLRECGVPDDLIAQLPAWFGRQTALQLHCCFIGYGQQDEEFASRLHARMRQERLRVWFAPEDPCSDPQAPEPIDEATRIEDILLLVLSEHSLHSCWVAREIQHARQREARDGRRILFPIRLVSLEEIRQSACLAGNPQRKAEAEICERALPDFSNWQDRDAFEAGFGQLLEELKAAVAGSRLLELGGVDAGAGLRQG
jgi:uncharacterized protein YjbI with pentapeptide repeats